MIGEAGAAGDTPVPVTPDQSGPVTAAEAPAQTTVPFPVLAAPTVVHVQTELGGEDQLQHEQDAGLGRVSYSLGELLDEFTNAPSNPAPTFDRLAQFKRDYAKLAPVQRQLFRAAAKRLIAPLSTTPPGEPGEPLVRELTEHPGFSELRVDKDTRAIYTFGQAVRRGQPHVIWCRVGSGDELDKPPAICTPAS